MHVWKENKKTGKQQICKLTLPLSQIHQKIYFLPFSKKISTPPKQNILVFSTHFPTFQINLPLFCHVLTKTTHTKRKQTIYATKVKRKQRIKETNESNSIENRDNSPYEEKQLLLRTTKVKKNFSLLIKIGKTKQVLGKI